MLLLSLADAAASSPVDPVTAAIIAGGSLVYALIAHRKEAKALPAACDCAPQIRESEDRVKLHVDALEESILAKMEATHKHAALIPTVITDVALIKDRVGRGQHR